MNYTNFDIRLVDCQAVRFRDKGQKFTIYPTFNFLEKHIFTNCMFSPAPEKSIGARDGLA